MATQNRINTTRPTGISLGGTNAASFGTSQGTVVYNGTSLLNYSSPKISSAGVRTNTSQPCFYAFQPSALSNATGDGTTYQLGSTTALTVSTNQSSSMSTNGTFTAPVAGIYLFTLTVAINSSAGTPALYTSSIISLVASGITYNLSSLNPGVLDGVASGTGVYSIYSSCMVKMAANDTAVVNITVSGSTKVVAIAGNTGHVTVFAGMLVC